MDTKTNKRPETTQVACQSESPCYLLCKKCGSDNIYRMFYKKGSETYVSVTRKKNVDSSEFVNREDNYHHPAIRDCIVHHCRCCQFEFDSDTSWRDKMSENNHKKSETSAVPLDCPVMTDVTELRKAAKCVFLVTEEDIAHDLSDKLNRASNTIEALQDFAIWMTGCGYDFCQHEYFCERRDKLLKV